MPRNKSERRNALGESAAGSAAPSIMASWTASGCPSTAAMGETRSIAEVLSVPSDESSRGAVSASATLASSAPSASEIGILMRDHCVASATDVGSSRRLSVLADRVSDGSA